MKIGDLVKANEHAFVEWLGGYYGIVQSYEMGYVDVLWNSDGEFYRDSTNENFLILIAEVKEHEV